MHGDYLNAWRCLLWVDTYNRDSPQRPSHIIRPLNVVPFSRCKNKDLSFTQIDFSKGEKGSSPLFSQSGSSTREQAPLAENTHSSFLELHHCTEHNVKKNKKSKTTLEGDCSFGSMPCFVHVLFSSSLMISFYPCCSTTYNLLFLINLLHIYIQTTPKYLDDKILQNLQITVKFM